VALLPFAAAACGRQSSFDALNSATSARRRRVARATTHAFLRLAIRMQNDRILLDETGFMF
jgi:hypothetical protein